MGLNNDVVMNRLVVLLRECKTINKHKNTVGDLCTVASTMVVKSRNFYQLFSWGKPTMFATNILSFKVFSSKRVQCARIF